MARPIVYPPIVSDYDDNDFYKVNMNQVVFSQLGAAGVYIVQDAFSHSYRQDRIGNG